MDLESAPDSLPARSAKTVSAALKSSTNAARSTYGGTRCLARSAAIISPWRSARCAAVARPSAFPPVISAALFARFASRQDDSPAIKAVAALRNQFGGHAVTTVGDGPGVAPEHADEAGPSSGAGEVQH